MQVEIIFKNGNECFFNVEMIEWDKEAQCVSLIDPVKTFNFSKEFADKYKYIRVFGHRHGREDIRLYAFDKNGVNGPGDDGRLNFSDAGNPDGPYRVLYDQIKTLFDAW